MTSRHHFPALLLILLFLTGCGPDADTPSRTHQAEPASAQSFAERYKAAQAREKPLLDSGVTAKMWQGTKNIIDEFFPEAAQKIAEEKGISLEAAETLLRERMKQAADRCEEEYVQEGGYGTIVTVLRAAEELAVIREVLEDEN